MNGALLSVWMPTIAYAAVKMPVSLAESNTTIRRETTTQETRQDNLYRTWKESSNAIQELVLLACLVSTTTH